MNNVVQIRKHRLCAVCFAALPAPPEAGPAPLPASIADVVPGRDLCARCQCIVSDARAVIRAKREGSA